MSDSLRPHDLHREAQMKALDTEACALPRMAVLCLPRNQCAMCPEGEVFCLLGGVQGGNNRSFEFGTLPYLSLVHTSPLPFGPFWFFLFWLHSKACETLVP